MKGYGSLWAASLEPSRQNRTLTLQLAQSCGVLSILGRIRRALKREPLLNPLLALLNRDLIQRVYIPKGPPNPLP